MASTGTETRRTKPSHILVLVASSLIAGHFGYVHIAQHYSYNAATNEMLLGQNATPAIALVHDRPSSLAAAMGPEEARVEADVALSRGTLRSPNPTTGTGSVSTAPTAPPPETLCNKAES